MTSARALFAVIAGAIVSIVQPVAPAVTQFVLFGPVQEGIALSVQGPIAVDPANPAANVYWLAVRNDRMAPTRFCPGTLQTTIQLIDSTGRVLVRDGNARADNRYAHFVSRLPDLEPGAIAVSPTPINLLTGDARVPDGVYSVIAVAMAPIRLPNGKCGELYLRSQQFPIEVRTS